MREILRKTQWWVFVLTVTLLSVTGHAQGDGRFTGTVLDPSGSTIASATVLVKNERTGEERTTTTNAQGRYAVPNLRPSSYKIGRAHV